MSRVGTTGIVASIVFFALGAILYWGIADAVEGVNLEMIGMIVMGLSALGFVLSLGGWFAARSDNNRALETDRTAAPAVDREVVRETHRR